MRGGSIKSIIAELLGRRDGVSFGKGSIPWMNVTLGGSMHMFVKGFFGGNGIVGAQVPVGAGISYLCPVDNRRRLCNEVLEEAGMLFCTLW
jgi:pyruvate dehydrogenase E1 component alpha subunit